MRTAWREWNDKSVGQLTSVDLTTEDVLKVLYQLLAVPFHSPMSTSGGQPLTACYCVRTLERWIN